MKCHWHFITRGFVRSEVKAFKKSTISKASRKMRFYFKLVCKSSAYHLFLPLACTAASVLRSPCPQCPFYAGVTGLWSAWLGG